MNKPAIIITGANGFIGECLVKYFYDKGWSIKALVHHAPEIRLENVEYISYDIENKPDESVFIAADYLVHCAYLRYEKNKNADAINTAGTKDLISLCRKNNVKMLFLSSFSAHPAAESHYGKTKLASEKLFDLSKDVILKPGLVLGKKGLFSEMNDRIKHSAYFPLVGGTQPMQTIYIDDLCTITERVLTGNYSGLFHIAEPASVSMKTFYTEQAALLNKKLMFIPVPVALLYIVCKLGEKTGVKLPVSSESVLGLKHLIKFDTKEDLFKLGISLKTYKESLKLLTR